MDSIGLCEVSVRKVFILASRSDLCLRSGAHPVVIWPFALLSRPVPLRPVRSPNRPFQPVCVLLILFLIYSWSVLICSSCQLTGVVKCSSSIQCVLCVTSTPVDHCDLQSCFQKVSELLQLLQKLWTFRKEQGAALLRDKQLKRFFLNLPCEFLVDLFLDFSFFGFLYHKPVRKSRAGRIPVWFWCSVMLFTWTLNSLDSLELWIRSDPRERFSVETFHSDEFSKILKTQENFKKLKFFHFYES